MIETIYIEKEVKDDLYVKNLCKKISPKQVIYIDRYTEVFNRNNQNFLLQKIKPSLILAKKQKGFLHKLDPFTCFSKNGYDLSHSVNCPFHCDYCYLQGCYRSGFYLLFVNFDDFKNEMESILQKENAKFFLGFDSDSLALESSFQILDHFYPFFEKHQKALFELRTKSVSIHSLLQKKPLKNLIIAFSLNPDKVIHSLEKKTPSLEMRLNALKTLQKKGFSIGLRFDPLIFIRDFEKIYEPFFEKVFSEIDPNRIHSATIGTVRFPKPYYERMKKLHIRPNFLSTLWQENGIFCYPEKTEKKLIDFAYQACVKKIEKNKLFIQTA